MNTYSGNLITMSDSYKVTHWKQYPKGAKRVFSFFESRGGRFDTVTFFGLQYLLRRYLSGVVVTQEKIEAAKSYFEKHFGTGAYFNEAGWDRIINVHKGVLPVLIRAVPEGMTIPVGNALMTIENTDPELPWLTNYLETLLSQVWYPTTVATQSREMKKVIMRYLEKTGDPSLIPFKLHDFGYRGSTSVESAGLGAAAHLVNFMGTDNLAGVDVAHDYYGEPMAGFSIPAAEHSTMTSWGKNAEKDAYANMLEQFPEGLVAVVSDSYDIFHACEKIWGEELRKQVLSRNGTLVVRPDSGNPPEVVVRVLDILGRVIGHTVNAKGYKLLDPHVRVIQGDGIDYEMLGSVLYALERDGWSADNVSFGSGGGLLQKMDRDTQQFAFKCSAIEIAGRGWCDVQKDPVTDPRKRSKAGRLALLKAGETYRTVRECVLLNADDNILSPVFRDGRLLAEQTFAQIRSRASL